MRLAPRRPVTATTIQSLKTKALRRTKTRVIDPETNDFVKPSFIGRTIASLKAPFTRHWWADRFEKVEGEVLVDGNLLSYSYLEAGVIEMIGALTGYFVVFNSEGFTPKGKSMSSLPDSKSY